MIPRPSSPTRRPLASPARTTTPLRAPCPLLPLPRPLYRAPRACKGRRVATDPQVAAVTCIWAPLACPRPTCIMGCHPACPRQVPPDHPLLHQHPLTRIHTPRDPLHPRACPHPLPCPLLALICLLLGPLLLQSPLPCPLRLCQAVHPLLLALLPLHHPPTPRLSLGKKGITYNYVWHARCVGFC